jgi:predicted nucleotidyltransferase
MLFSELVDAMLDPALMPEVDRLLALKRGAPEVREIPQSKELNRYLDDGIAQVKEKLSAFSREQAPDWKELNDLFLSELKRDRSHL